MEEYLDQNLNVVLKYSWALIGSIIALIAPALPLVYICFFAIILDAIFAYRLSKRVKKVYPDKTKGKFMSSKFAKVFTTSWKVFLVIILAFLIDTFICTRVPIDLANVVAGAVCLWQLWSILENESSCNNAKWAIIAQRIMVDKTERHFDIDLSELRKEIKEIKEASNES